MEEIHPLKLEYQQCYRKLSNQIVSSDSGYNKPFKLFLFTTDTITKQMGPDRRVQLNDGHKFVLITEETPIKTLRYREKE